MSLSWLRSHLHHPQRPLQQPVTSQGPLTAEGLRLSRALWSHFWDKKHSHFTTEKASSETVVGNGWHGYTLWPFVIAIEALLEAEAAAPGSFTNEIHAALEAVEKFRCRDMKAAGGYCAWVWFQGNTDVYYDDDAQVAIALLRAYELPSTRHQKYLNRAQSIVEFLFTGWDHVRGGMRWHVDKPDSRNACTTNLSAIAALKLAAAGGGNVDVPRLVEFAQRCSDWVITALSADSGLIKDGAGGGPTWTYNTGAALYTLCLLWRFTGNASLTAKAVRLAVAACDRGKSLYDQSCPSVEFRYWWDSTFFVQLLVEGLVEFVETFGGEFPDAAATVRTEVKRHMEYFMAYLKGREDGLYVRSLRLYVISMAHLKMYQEMTGDTKRQAALDESERWRDEASLKMPVAQRGVCKSLLGNGGAARSLLIAGRIM